MRHDETQCPVDYNHVNVLQTSMDEKGACKGKVLHGYIDVRDIARGNHSKRDAALIDEIKSCNKHKGDGKVSVGILPNDIPVHISDGNHHLYAFCRHFVENWDKIQDLQPPLKLSLAGWMVDWPFPENLGKGLEEIFAQKDTWWLVNLEYIHK